MISADGEGCDLKEQYNNRACDCELAKIEKQWDNDMFQLGWQTFALMPAMDMLGAKSLDEYLNKMEGVSSPLLTLLRFLNSPTKKNRTEAISAIYGLKENFNETREIVEALSKKRPTAISN